MQVNVLWVPHMDSKWFISALFVDCDDGRILVWVWPHTSPQWFRSKWTIQSALWSRMCPFFSRNAPILRQHGMHTFLTRLHGRFCCLILPRNVFYCSLSIRTTYTLSSGLSCSSWQIVSDHIKWMTAVLTYKACSHFLASVWSLFL